MERIQRIVATAFITKNGKLLVAKRREDEDLFPGDYELPGGKLKFGEDPKTALKREIKEELDVDININEPFHCFTYYSDNKDIQYVEIVFFAELNESEDNIKLNDHTAIAWITKDEINSYKASKEANAVMHKGFEILSRASNYA
jgi:8-oxo-dGTP diphosphatase